jgi:pimeloyl-ACP methyl ester carboxylesterase
MFQIMRMRLTLVLLIIVTGMPQTSTAQTTSSQIGIVLMHGKGGSPTRYVSGLASSLAKKGYLVANLEMPWSGRRDYDVSVSVAEREIESALDTLRSKGAKKLFVAGHSQGGLFALYFGSKHFVDGIIAIAPGGSVSSLVFREKLGASVELARKLIAEGKGNEKTRFSDYEGSKGTYPIASTPEAYLSWFDPDGAMNQTAAVKSMNPQVPVLFIVPKGDYPGLLKAKQPMFDSLPSNPLTKLYEPDSTHLDAPSASRDEIVRWTTEVASRANPALQGTPASGRPLS